VIGVHGDSTSGFYLAGPAVMHSQRVSISNSRSSHAFNRYIGYRDGELVVEESRCADLIGGIGCQAATLGPSGPSVRSIAGP
jgi:hypothetical protein